MSLIQVGLVDKTGTLDPNLVQNVAAALNVQVMRDVPQFWNVQATVIFLPNASKIPSGVWPVQLVKTLPPDEGGFHLDRHNQPFAEVIATPSNDAWTIAASHETIEMLVDPAGNRMQSSRSIEVTNGTIQDGTNEFEYLVEACDPCEADTFAYGIQGVAVSDFITPHFYDPVTAAGTRYSFTGAIKAPRQVLNGGYISFVNQSTGDWQQITNLNNTPQLVTLGTADQARSLREWVDNQMASTKLPTTTNITKTATNTALLERCRNHRSRLDQIAQARAKMLDRGHAHGKAQGSR